MSHFEPIFGMIDPQWLICLGLGDKKTTWGSGLASCSESLFTRHQKIHWGLGDMFVAKKKTVGDHDDWSSMQRHSCHYLDVSNPQYKTWRVNTSWNCRPFGYGGLLNKDPIVRLTAQVRTLDRGFSDETLFSYNLPSKSNQLLDPECQRRSMQRVQFIMTNRADLRKNSGNLDLM